MPHRDAAPTPVFGSRGPFQSRDLGTTGTHSPYHPHHILTGPQHPTRGNTAGPIARNINPHTATPRSLAASSLVPTAIMSLQVGSKCLLEGELSSVSQHRLSTAAPLLASSSCFPVFCLGDWHSTCLLTTHTANLRRPCPTCARPPPPPPVPTPRPRPPLLHD